MNESSWDDCLELNSSIKISPNKSKAKSLIETAKGRLDYLAKDSENPQTAIYIFEGKYTCVVELIHALTILDGYKINNHICLGNYIKDVLKKEELFRIFDDCRIKRNSLVYYGRRMDFEICKDTIKKLNHLINELDRLINQKI